MNSGKHLHIILPGFFLLLGCAGLLFPTVLTWGFHFFGFLSGAYYAGAICLTAAATYFLFSPRETDRLSAVLALIRRHERLAVFSVAILLMICSALLRVRVPLLGDGFFLVKNFSDAFHGDAPIYYRNEPLATAFFWQFFRLTGIPPTYQEFLTKVLLSELLLEAGFLFISYRIVRELSDRPGIRIAGFALIAAMPYMQLFFGYVEIYSAVLFTLSLYLFAAILCFRGKVPFWAPVLSFILLGLTHYLSLAVLPSLLYAGWVEFRTRGWKNILIGAGAMVLIAGGILVAAGFDVDQFTEYVPYHHYLSLTPRTFTPDAETDPYTLFSPHHLADLANYLLLMGVGYLLLLWSGIQTELTADRALSEIQFFFLSALAPAAVVLIGIKFDLGAARDWDTFSPFFLLIPFIVVTFVNRTTSPYLLRLTLLTIVILLLHSGSFWIVNSHTDGMLKRTGTFLDRKAISPGAYYNTSLSLAQYYHQAGEDASAITVWQGYAAAFPLDPRGYQNLLINYRKINPPPMREIGHVLVSWIGARPRDSAAVIAYRNYCIDRGNVFFQNGVSDSAAFFYNQAIVVDSTYPVAYNNLGTIYAMRGDTLNARLSFVIATELNPSYGEAFYNLAALLEDRGDPSAEGYYRKAADLNIDAARKKIELYRHFAGKPRTR